MGAAEASRLLELGIRRCVVLRVLEGYLRRAESETLRVRDESMLQRLSVERFLKNRVENFSEASPRKI